MFFNEEELDPDIRETVKWLRSLGFETVDSGDGITKPDEFEGVLRVPHVAIMSSYDTLLADADRLHGYINTLGSVAGFCFIQATYSPDDGQCILLLTGLSDTTLKLANGSSSL